MKLVVILKYKIFVWVDTRAGWQPVWFVLGGHLRIMQNSGGKAFDDMHFIDQNSSWLGQFNPFRFLPG